MLPAPFAVVRGAPEFRERVMRGLRTPVLASAIAFAALSIPSVAAASGAPARPSAAPAAVAPGAPGDESFFDLARKDCVGTARNTTSKVWFTVADGVLSDTYWPTVDATNVHTLQYLVSDGHSFTDLQTRDMTYRVLDDPTGMACTVIASSAAHHYSIRTTYIADPARDAVDMQVGFDGPTSDHVYVRLDPLAGGTGGGVSPTPNAADQNAGGNSAVLATPAGTHGPVPVAFNTNTHTIATNRSYAVPTYEALESSDGFAAASVGYSGSASDGLTTLDATHSLSPAFASAPDGHVALTAELPDTHGRPLTLSLGFGTTQSAALATAGAAVRGSFDLARLRYELGWARYDAGLLRPSRSLGAAAVREYYESLNVVKASEDKTFPGAIAAGLASPWGQSVPAGIGTNGVPTYFGSYRETFSRDSFEAASTLLVAGDRTTAQDTTRFLFDRQQLPNGSIPRNSLLNGESAPDTGGLQLDETSYPILLAWQSGLAGDHTLYTQHIVPAADFLVAHGPSDGVERWEEQTGFSPSTIAAEIAGLTAAANIAQANHDPARAAVYQATADDFQRNIKNWTVTTTGPDAPRYFIRLSKTGDPNAAISYSLGNGGPTVDQRQVIDAGFLDLVRLGELPANDPDIQASVAVVDKQISVSTPSGTGYYRYGTSAAEGSADGYGDCFQPSQTSCTTIGAPWAPTGVGTGHLWPVLSGEHGEYEVAAGDTASAQSLLTSMRNMTSGQGLEPEQAWEDPDLAASPFGSDPETASIGFTDGKPAGSASPLTWAQAQYARLTLGVTNGHDLETPQITLSRYVTNGPPGTLPLTVLPPTAGTGATETVSGTTTPNAFVAAEGSSASGGTAPLASTNADSTGAFTLVVPVSFGPTTITVTATLNDATAYSQVTASNFTLPGTSVLNVTDPTGDDNGPGTFQYPTDSAFLPGAFDLLGMKVNQDDTNVYVQVQVRNLGQTFGTDFGAQLLDLYVHAPMTSPTSTGATFTSRNYTIAPADAWSQSIEAQGFGNPTWNNASGTSLGTPQFVVDDSGGTATLVFPKATFGTVGSGWAFTVALFGQDGFGTDNARAFTSNPGDFSFGECPVGGSSPICSVPVGQLPEVMDTITPAGAHQSTELDPTAGPVVLQGVTVP
jgi:glucoamylase